MQFNITVENSDNLAILETKRLFFPDGVERLITMEKRWWIAMGWLADNDGTEGIQETIDIAYQLATEFHDPQEMTFEEQIRDCFFHSISGGVRAVLKNQNKIIQDNKAYQSS